MITFPPAPTLNQLFTSGDTTWQWDGAKWGIYRLPLNTIMVPKDNPAVGTVPTGTLASPPVGLAIGDLWEDTTSSTGHPILRVARVTT